MPTVEQFLAKAEQAVAAHDPYVFGGTSLTRGCDCSGLGFSCLLAIGVNQALVPRTSEAQFAAWKPAPGPARGVAVFFNVPGDGQAQPAHVGYCTSATTMVEEPHTGLDAENVTIPNIAGIEMVMGYRYLPVDYSTPAPAPAPSPSPAPTQEDDDMQPFIAHSPTRQMIVSQGSKGLVAQPVDTAPDGSNFVGSTATQLDWKYVPLSEAELDTFLATVAATS